MTTNNSPLTVVEGPKGKAEIFEDLTNDGGRVEGTYEVRFSDGATETFKSLGEAYVTAKEKCGVR